MSIEGRRGGRDDRHAGYVGRAARAREALVARHAELREVLDYWAGMLVTAADSGGLVRAVRNLLRAFLADEVLPQTRAEERTLLPGGTARSGRRCSPGQLRWPPLPLTATKDLDLSQAAVLAGLLRETA